MDEAGWIEGAGEAGFTPEQINRLATANYLLREIEERTRRYFSPHLARVSSSEELHRVTGAAAKRAIDEEAPDLRGVDALLLAAVAETFLQQLAKDAQARGETDDVPLDETDTDDKTVARFAAHTLAYRAVADEARRRASRVP